MSVPEDLRPAVGKELDALIRGARPDLLMWVRAYGSRGATVIAQPEEMWSHPRADAVPTDDGGWHVVVPLWTADESPSDLSAEVDIAPDGTAQLAAVHVL